MLKKSLLFVAASILPLAAQAQTVTNTFDLTGTDFQVYFGTPTPYLTDTVHLNFTLTTDPSAAPVGPLTSGFVINSFNLPYALTYSIASNGTLIIATNGDPSVCTHDPDSFCAFIADAFTSNPNLFFMEQSSAEGGWAATTRTLTVNASAVPEPASWGMMVLGFGAMGGAVRYRRRRVSVAYS